MQLTSIMIGLTALFALGTALPLAAQTQPAGSSLKCATSLSPTTQYGCISGRCAETASELVTNIGTACKSAVILTFDGNAPLLPVQNAGTLAQLAVEMCDLWDGPYRRKDGLGNVNYDYVVANTNVPNGSSPVTAFANVEDQIAGFGTPEITGITLTATVNAMSLGSSGVAVNIRDDSGGPSQIFDYPGPEFTYALKSQGGGSPQASLLCAVNAWYYANFDGTQPESNFNANGTFKGFFGFANYPFTHNVNSLWVGWGGGPSGLASQGNVDTACDFMNAGQQQEDVVKLYGTYKGDEMTRPPHFNVSNCTAIERVCTSLEPSGFGRPNSCNPDGGQAGGLGASIVQTKAGQNSTCLSFSSGTRLSSYGSC